MKIVKSVGILLIIVGLIFALFATLDPRVKTPIFEDQNIKYVAYREAIVTTDGVTKTYEQVVLLVTKEAQLPDTKVTINNTAYPITSGMIYYFSGYYFYIPTFYTTAKYMSIGPMTYTNVYDEYAPKYEKIRRVLSRTGIILIIIGLIMFFIPSIHLPERVAQKEEHEEVLVTEEYVGEFDEEEWKEEDEIEEAEDIDMYLPPVDE